jgi:Putative peptidoglycan binding domain
MQNEPNNTKKRIIQFGGEVRFAQGYLTRYGYLAPRSYRAGELDEPTRLAISRFQQFFGLSVTGKLEDLALQTMTIVRCGLPDPSVRARFATRCAWTAAIPISYAFLGGSATISDGDALSAVQNAIASWHPGDIPNVPAFQQVDSQQNPEVLIEWLKTDTDLVLLTRRASLCTNWGTSWVLSIRAYPVQ